MVSSFIEINFQADGSSQLFKVSPNKRDQVSALLITFRDYLAAQREAQSPPHGLMEGLLGLH